MENIQAQSMLAAWSDIARDVDDMPHILASASLLFSYEKVTAPKGRYTSPGGSLPHGASGGTCGRYWSRDGYDEKAGMVHVPLAERCSLARISRWIIDLR